MPSRRPPRERSSLVRAAALALVAAIVVAGIAAAWVNFNRGVSEAMADAEAHASEIPVTLPPDDTRLGGDATIESVRDMVAASEPLVVSVLGDSTGNQDEEWVYLWAQHLAETRAVTYHSWDDARRKYLPARELSSTGPETEIWNMSAPGQAAAYPATSIPVMQPVKPDVVIYNFGHNNTADDFDTSIYATLTAVEEQWDGPVPSVAILQNPERGATAVKHRATIQAVRETIAPAFGLPVVDVWAAFKDADQPLSVLISNADGLGVHPSPAGSRVWADAVTAALG